MGKIGKIILMAVVMITTFYGCSNKPTEKMVFDEINRNFNYDVDVLSVKKLSDWPETGDMGEQDYVLECEGTFRGKDKEVCLCQVNEYQLEAYTKSGASDYFDCGGIRLSPGKVGKLKFYFKFKKTDNGWMAY